MRKIFILLIFLGLSLSAIEQQTIDKDNFNSAKTTLCKKKSDRLFEVKQRGCCSWHGGVAGCSGSSVVCNDGTYSPSCTCNSSINPLG